MHIALINPHTNITSEESFPHLGLGYLAAVAKQQGHQVEVFDLRLQHHSQGKRYLQDHFDVVGITATSFNYSKTLEIAQSVKDSNPNSVVVLGGPHVAIAEPEIFAESPFDVGIMGEGEGTFAELLTELEDNRSKPQLGHIAGIIYVEKGQVVQTPARPCIDNIDQILWPDFASEDAKYYSRYPLLTSRGCPFQCVYCNASLVWGKSWRARSPENIVAEIKQARNSDHWQNLSFTILDDTFNLQPERVEAFCDLLIEEKLDINYYVWGFRADRAPMRMLEKMKASGCLSVSVGIESANPRVLEQMRKGETIEQIAETLSNLKKAGIYPVGLFMIGNPGDNLETVKETLRFVKKNRLYLATFNMALPYPKTQLWHYIATHGKFLRKDYINYHHYSQTSIFETPDFSAEQRSEAFRLAQRREKIQRLKFEIMRKIDFIRKGQFRHVSWKRLAASGRRTIKYFLDLVFTRESQEKL